MGRNNTKYKKNLQEQIYDKLLSMQAFGTSKYEAKQDGTMRGKIFSFSTFKAYKKHCNYFAGWMRENHPEVSTLKKARKYVTEYLQMRVDAGLSAWTVHLEACALGKLYGIEPGDPDFFEAPQRERVNVKRSRGDAVRDAGFSEKNNDELVKFCRATGLRREELESLKGGDCVTIEQIFYALNHEKGNPGMLRNALFFEGVKYFVYVRNGKGGKERLVPIIGDQQEAVYKRIKSTPKNERVWLHVHTHADIHGYRSDYANALYKSMARDISELRGKQINYKALTGKLKNGKETASAVYYCRKDEKGKALDRRAMIIASKALGHEREDVIANSYLRGL